MSYEPLTVNNQLIREISDLLSLVLRIKCYPRTPFPPLASAAPLRDTSFVATAIHPPRTSPTHPPTHPLLPIGRDWIWELGLDLGTRHWIRELEWLWELGPDLGTSGFGN